MIDTSALLFQWGPHRGPHGPMGPGSGMQPWIGGGGAGVTYLWSLLGLVLIGAVVVAGLYFAVRLLRAPESGVENDALSVLRQRYARGEIDEEEFDERRSRLTPRSPP